ncbi:MAG: LPD16 domain-containing protein [Sphaerochaetaceae bacterium]
MKLEHKAYIINHRTYLYIMDFEGSFDYSFYNDHYLVMNTGSIPKDGHTLEQAVRLICSRHYLKPEELYELSEAEMEEMIDHIDDYEQVNVL